MSSIFHSTFCEPQNGGLTKNPVDVFCRIRPLPKNQNQKGLSCVILKSSDTLELTQFDDQKSKYKYSYTFKRVFPENTGQDEVFEETTVPLIRGLFRGENGLLFTYGVTCSGKTYTMFGNYENPGLVPKCIYCLFNTIHDKQTPRFLIKTDKMNGFDVQTEEEALADQLKYDSRKLDILKKQIKFLNYSRKLDDNLNGLVFTVFITYVEIYNNIVYDLLNETPSLNRILREDCNKNIYVNNVREIEVKSASEALAYYQQGSKRKQIAQTVLNNTSSRSHSIFTIRLIIQDKYQKDQFKISQLSLVDLAGTERTSRTNTSGIRLKEASCINNSLMSLRQCLELLRENEIKGTKKLIPYRESRLTHLFKNYFEGCGSVKILICINPKLTDLEENFHVLKFAEMTQEVQITKYENVKTPPIPEIKLSPQNTNINRLIQYLKKRNNKLTKLQDIQENATTFRSHLFHFKNDIQTLNRQVQHFLPAEKQKVEMMKEKYREIELKLDKISEKCENKDDTIMQLNKCLEDKDSRLHEVEMEKHKQRKKLDEITNKLKNELDIKLQYQKEYLQNQMKEHANKLELVKNILTEPIIPTPEIHEIPEIPKIPQKCESLIPRIKKAPVSNIRYNKSCTKTAKWLEHKPGLPTPLTTVLQPKMKRKKCITSSISKEDIVNSKRNKYILIQQSTDEDGELETELIKGDIIPTFSGGAQVILNDVEKLTQETPLHSQLF